MTDTRQVAVVASEMFKNFLADKRTVLAYLRTGIAVLMLPMSIVTILIATSSQYEISEVLTMLSIMIIISGILIVVGVTMVVQAFRQLSAVNRKLRSLETEFIFLSRWHATCPMDKVPSAEGAGSPNRG